MMCYEWLIPLKAITFEKEITIFWFTLSKRNFVVENQGVNIVLGPRSLCALYLQSQLFSTYPQDSQTERAHPLETLDSGCFRGLAVWFINLLTLTRKLIFCFPEVTRKTTFCERSHLTRSYSKGIVILIVVLGARSGSGMPSSSGTCPQVQPICWREDIEKPSPCDKEIARENV
jgi:hypothetical protein